MERYHRERSGRLSRHLRGRFIAIVSHKGKLRAREEVTLRGHIGSLETQLADLYTPSPSLSSELQQAKLELNALLISVVERKLFYTKQRYYEKGEKVDTILAYQLMKRTEERQVKEVRDGSGLPHTEPRDILSCFEAFYKKLYSKEIDPAPSGVASYLEALALPVLPLHAQATINVPITPEEVVKAIQAMPSGMSTGRDGFKCFYSKTYATILAPKLALFFNAVVLGSTLQLLYFKQTFLLSPRRVRIPLCVHPIVQYPY